VITAWAIAGSYLVGLYDAAVITDARQVLARSALVGALSTLGGMLTMYALWLFPAGRAASAINALCVALTLTLSRFAYRALLLRAPRMPVLLCSSARTAARISELLAATPLARYEVVGFVGDASGATPLPASAPPHLGPLSQLADVCRERCVGLVAVAPHETPPAAGYVPGNHDALPSSETIRTHATTRLRRVW
jgi:hypothetical protein